MNSLKTRKTGLESCESTLSQSLFLVKFRSSHLRSFYHTPFNSTVSV